MNKRMISLGSHHDQKGDRKTVTTVQSSIQPLVQMATLHSVKHSTVILNALINKMQTQARKQ